MTDFESAKGAVDLRVIVLKYTSLDCSGHGPCPLCGGTDRFYIHKGGERCGCRKCSFQGDAIELVHKIEGVSRTEAAKILLGKSTGGDIQASTGRRLRAKPTITPPRWLDDKWQQRALNIVNASVHRLDGSPGADYLLSRGIDLNTCLRYRVGYVPDYFGRPAVVIPWVDETGVVSAVKYRYIVPWKNRKGEIQRYGAERGSGCQLFGPNGLKDSDTMIVVEGEINALAIAQSTPFDVLSVGSQGNRTGLDLLQEVFRSRKYARVLFWFDEEDRTKSVIEGKFLGAAGMKSPGGKDAADILLEHGEEVLRSLVETVVSKSHWKRT